MLFVPNSNKSIGKKCVVKASITEETNKLLEVNRAQNFITLSTAASHWTVPYTEPIESTPHPHTLLRTNVHTFILFSNYSWVSKWFLSLRFFY
jgi:hypothetical protein